MLFNLAKSKIEEIITDKIFGRVYDSIKELNHIFPHLLNKVEANTYRGFLHIAFNPISVYDFLKQIFV